MKKQLNYRLLTALFALLVLGGGATFLLHTWQMRRHAGTLMAQASAAESAGQLDRAALYLQRYLVFAPQDNTARARYGEMAEQLAATDHERWRAVAAYEQALYHEPSRQDVRRRLALLALRLGWYTEAQQHLEILLRDHPGQGDLEAALGRCEEEAGDYPRAVASYQRAVRDAPKQIEAYVRLAALLQYRLDQPENGSRVLDALLRNNDQSAEAYWTRAVHRMSHGALTKAARDMDRACELAPDDPRIRLTAAELARRRGQIDEARRHLHHGRVRSPQTIAVHRALAALELECDRSSAAIDALRQGLQALPDHPHLLHPLAQTLIDSGDEGAAEEVIARLRRPGAPPYLAHYLQGRLQMKRREWPQAIQTLEEVASSSLTAPALASRASLALADCHEQRGDNDRRLAALRKAVALDDSSAPARMALAAMLRGAGRIEEALEAYREVVQLRQAPDQSWLFLGRLLLQRNRSLPPKKRRWADVERVLERAARLPSLELPLLTLRADMLVERGQVEQAQALLEEAAAAHPNETMLATALAALPLREGQVERSAHILAEARQKASLGVAGQEGSKRLDVLAPLYQAEIALCASREPRKARQALHKLEKELESLPVETQDTVLVSMAAMYLQLGELAEGQRLCRLLAGRSTADLSSRLRLVDLALQAGDDTLLANLVVDVRRLEGEEGAWWRYGEASRLLRRMQRGDMRSADEARSLVTDILRRRPDWSRGALLEAYLRDLDGETAAAIDAYLRAFRAGERRPGMVERLVRLLMEQGRLDEADEAIRRFQLQATPTAEMARLGTEIALRQRNTDRARELAVLAVPLDSNDYQRLIWLGQALGSAGRPGEAEDALRRAIRLRDDLAEPWIALVSHLAKTGQLQQAADVQDDMQRHLPANQAPVALAVCAEVLGRLDRAEEHYRQALAGTPRDGFALQRAARFHLRLNHPGEAEALLRRMLAADAEVSAAEQAWSRRQLALLLAFAPAGTSDEAGYRAALTLLQENERRKEDSLFDRRARLLVEGTRASGRQAALRQLEASSKVQPFTNEELFRLVQLYEADKDLDKAHERMLDLLGLDRNNPEYLAHHIDRLLRRGQKDEARAWIVRLQKLEPDSSRVRAFLAVKRK
jgi:tetratricopeptide (TPR) repeat protein